MLRHYQDPYHAKVCRAGFQAKDVQIGTISLHYAEGLYREPALLLHHAQHMDWCSYSRVLPALSQTFHIFAVDCHGHGKTVAPPESLNANRIGRDLAQFIRQVIKEPVFLSRNSSGGLLPVWLAANEPMWVKAVLLEDPALFSSEVPRLYHTIADKSFSLCSRFLQEKKKIFCSTGLTSVGASSKNIPD